MTRPLRIPKLCRHRRSGLAYVTDPATKGEVYLGRYGSEEAGRKYQAWLMEFLARANPRVLPVKGGSVAQLLDAFLSWADGYYLKRGKPTSERKNLGVLAGRIATYADLPAEDFGPTQLKALRAKMVSDDLSRTTANAYTQKIVRIWRWGVEHELVSGECLVRLKAVRGLAKGRTSARETKDVPPVPLDVVEATIPFLSPMVQAIVRVQLACGMRPGEAVAVRPVDVDRSATPWLYRPAGHKTEHKGKARTVYVGPAGRAELLPWLEKCPRPDAWAFPGRKGGHYTVDRLTHVIAQAAEAAGVDHWHANQLRHSAATAIRKKYGIEAAQVILGHSELKTSQIYAEKDEARAREIAEEMG